MSLRGLSPFGERAPPSKATSSVAEKRRLQQAIVQLQQDLLQTKAELHKSSDQLNCLILLVKRAWTGDKSAAVHVANIIGVAPPDIKEESLADKVILSSKPKSQSLNNWAILTIKLLNREYKVLEAQVQARQKIFLQNRQNYLEEQLIQHKDLVTRGQAHNHRRSNTADEVERLFIKTYKAKPERAVSAKMRVKHLYHKPNKTDDETPLLGDDLTWADLIVHPNKTSQVNKVTDGIFKLTTEDQDCQSDDFDPDKIDLMYDDSKRYSQSGMYDTDGVVLTKTKRPISAFQQKSSDVMRSRPLRAVIKKYEYKTTHPVSAFVRSTKGQRLNDKGLSDDKTAQPLPGKNTRPSVRTKSAGKKLTSVGKMPDSVVKFEEDLIKMHELENDVKQTYQRLQKKIGIPLSGQVE